MIQNLLGQIRQEPYPEVTFEKFRQFEPFEIGISNADPVLTILAALSPRLKENRSNLHDFELQKADEEDYLSFLENRMNGGSESESAVKTVSNLESLNSEVDRNSRADS
jgi:hypothetical protein